MAGMNPGAPGTAPAFSGGVNIHLLVHQLQEQGERLQEQGQRLNHLEKSNAKQRQSITDLQSNNANLQNEVVQQRQSITNLHNETARLGKENQYLGCELFGLRQVQDHDSKCWGGLFLDHVTAGILLGVKEKGLQPFRANTHFQNARVHANTSHAAIKSIMRILGIEDEVKQQQFCIKADHVIDERNRKAQFNSAVDLRAAVAEAMDIFARHPSLYGEFEFRFVIISNFAKVQATFPAWFR